LLNPDIAAGFTQHTAERAPGTGPSLAGGPFAYRLRSRS
jgi:hypothetical protein